MSAEPLRKVEEVPADPENGVAVSEKPRTEKKVLSSAEEDAAGKIYPPTREVIPVMVAVFMALFLVSLVSTRIRPKPSKNTC